jgi:hypothetical protein
VPDLEARLAEIDVRVKVFYRSQDRIGDGDWTPQDHQATLVAADAEFLLAALRCERERADEMARLAKAAKSQAAAPDYDEEAIKDALWAVVDAALSLSEAAPAEGER